MKQDKQPRRPGKPAAGDQRHPPSDMNTLAKGGDKESHEPLRKQLGSSASPENGAPKRKR